MLLLALYQRASDTVILEFWWARNACDLPRAWLGRQSGMLREGQEGKKEDGLKILPLICQGDLNGGGRRQVVGTSLGATLT